ncbi:unnamed protein product [Amoebophrya sp. A25]|nr:unnamed protein product [Amoebophrya sp. A25]|eukprot:GSA25T00016103001.1
MILEGSCLPEGGKRRMRRVLAGTWTTAYRGLLVSFLIRHRVEAVSDRKLLRVEEQLDTGEQESQDAGTSTRAISTRGRRLEIEIDHIGHASGTSARSTSFVEEGVDYAREAQQHGNIVVRVPGENASFQLKRVPHGPWTQSGVDAKIEEPGTAQDDDFLFYRGATGHLVVRATDSTVVAGMLLHGSDGFLALDGMTFEETSETRTKEQGQRNSEGTSSPSVELVSDGTIRRDKSVGAAKEFVSDAETGDPELPKRWRPSSLFEDAGASRELDTVQETVEFDVGSGETRARRGTMLQARKTQAQGQQARQGFLFQEDAEWSQQSTSPITPEGATGAANLAGGESLIQGAASVGFGTGARKSAIHSRVTARRYRFGNRRIRNAGSYKGPPHSLVEDKAALGKDVDVRRQKSGADSHVEMKKVRIRDQHLQEQTSQASSTSAKRTMNETQSNRNSNNTGGNRTDGVNQTDANKTEAASLEVKDASGNVTRVREVAGLHNGFGSPLPPSQSDQGEKGPIAYAEATVGYGSNKCYNGDDDLHQLLVYLIADRSFTKGAASDSTDLARRLMALSLWQASFIFEHQFHIRFGISDATILTGDPKEVGAGDLAGCPDSFGDNNPLTKKLDALWPPAGSEYRRKTSEDGAAFLHIFTLCRCNKGSVGLAEVEHVCDPVPHGISYWTGAMTWHTVAHEIGHNLGAQHPAVSGSIATTNAGIMGYGDGRYNGVFQFRNDYGQANHDKMCGLLQGLAAATAGSRKRNCLVHYHTTPGMKCSRLSYLCGADASCNAYSGKCETAREIRPTKCTSPGTVCQAGKTDISNACDANFATFWHSDCTVPQNIMIDLGGEFKVDYLDLFGMLTDHFPRKWKLWGCPSAPTSASDTACSEGEVLNDHTVVFREVVSHSYYYRNWNKPMGAAYSFPLVPAAKDYQHFKLEILDGNVIEDRSGYVSHTDLPIVEYPWCPDGAEGAGKDASSLKSATVGVTEAAKRDCLALTEIRFRQLQAPGFDPSRPSCDIGPWELWHPCSGSACGPDANWVRKRKHKLGTVDGIAGRSCLQLQLVEEQSVTKPDSGLAPEAGGAVSTTEEPRDDGAVVYTTDDFGGVATTRPPPRDNFTANGTAAPGSSSTTSEEDGGHATVMVVMAVGGLCVLGGAAYLGIVKGGAAAMEGAALANTTGAAEAQALLEAAEDPGVEQIGEDAYDEPYYDQTGENVSPDGQEARDEENYAEEQDGE